MLTVPDPSALDVAGPSALDSGSKSSGIESPLYRIGAVARMTRLPIATLRNWERRYRVAALATTASGHRLYTASDVLRVVLLKQLVDVGHSIGSIAHLDQDRLREVATTHVRTRAVVKPAPPAASASWRVAIVGTKLLHRLHSNGMADRLQRHLVVVATFDAVAQASRAVREVSIDTLLIHVTRLHRRAIGALQLAAHALGVCNVAVCYSVGTSARRAEFEAAGIDLLHLAQDDADLAAALQSLSDSAPPRQEAPPMDELPAELSAGSVPVKTDIPTWLAELPHTPPPPRYDDAILSDFANLSSTVACECPQNLADLLIRLSAFETYSAECVRLTPADVELHAWLQHIAGTARALFETALERIAVHEGLMLPD